MDPLVSSGEVNRSVERQTELGKNWLLARCTKACQAWNGPVQCCTVSGTAGGPNGRPGGKPSGGADGGMGAGAGTGTGITGAAPGGAGAGAVVAVPNAWGNHAWGAMSAALVEGAADRTPMVPVRGTAGSTVDRAPVAPGGAWVDGGTVSDVDPGDRSAGCAFAISGMDRIAPVIKAVRAAGTGVELEVACWPKRAHGGPQINCTLVWNQLWRAQSNVSAGGAATFTWCTVKMLSDAIVEGWTPWSTRAPW